MSNIYPKKEVLLGGNRGNFQPIPLETLTSFWSVIGSNSMQDWGGGGKMVQEQVGNFGV